MAYIYAVNTEQLYSWQGSAQLRWTKMKTPGFKVDPETG